MKYKIALLSLLLTHSLTYNLNMEKIHNFLQKEKLDKRQTKKISNAELSRLYTETEEGQKFRKIRKKLEQCQMFHFNCNETELRKEMKQSEHEFESSQAYKNYQSLRKADAYAWWNNQKINFITDFVEEYNNKYLSESELLHAALDAMEHEKNKTADQKTNTTAGMNIFMAAEIETHKDLRQTINREFGEKK